MLYEKIEFEPGEEVLKMVRKHWFIIVTKLLGAFIMFLLPFVILFFVALFPNLFLSEKLSLADYTALISFGAAAWTVLSLMAAFATWTHYFLDLWIITDRRIILVDQIGFFNRSVSMFRLERLQDIEFKVSGLIPTLLDFGTIQAQTAGTDESNFKTSGLPDPSGLQALIQQAMDARLRELRLIPEHL